MSENIFKTLKKIAVRRVPYQISKRRLMIKTVT